MIEYYNLDKRNNLILCEDKRHSSTYLYDYLYKSLEQVGYIIESFEKENQSKYILRVLYRDESISLILFLKNITGAGWKEKPKIKRVQVSNVMDTFKNYKTNSKTYFMIIGFYNFDDNPIFVAWDAYRYVNHNTIRSCYVSVDSLRRGYEKEYYIGVDSSQKIWIFKPNFLKKFIDDYIKYIISIKEF